MFSKSPHFGDKRSKVYVDIHINHIAFKTNDYFLRNSYYTLYFKGSKNKKIKSRNITRTLEDLLDTELPVDDALSCSATLFVDYFHEKYLAGKFKNKYRNIVVRQMTKLRSGEVLYRDVGYVNLPLHEFVRNPDKIDSRLAITHPINKIDAFVDCSIRVKHDSFQSTVPSNAGLVLNKKLSRTLSMVGVTEKPAKKSLISINSQYFDTTHVEGEEAVTTLRRGPLGSRGGSAGDSMSNMYAKVDKEGDKDSDDEEDGEPSKILLMEKGDVSYFLKSTLEKNPSDMNITMLPEEGTEVDAEKENETVQKTETETVHGAEETKDESSDSVDYTEAYNSCSVFDMTADVTRKESYISKPIAPAAVVVDTVPQHTAAVESVPVNPSVAPKVVLTPPKERAVTAPVAYVAVVTPVKPNFVIAAASLPAVEYVPPQKVDEKGVRKINSIVIPKVKAKGSAAMRMYGSPQPAVKEEEQTCEVTTGEIAGEEEPVTTEEEFTSKEEVREVEVSESTTDQV